MFLQEWLNFLVSSELLLNFTKVGRVVFKVGKQDFGFDFPFILVLLFFLRVPQHLLNNFCGAQECALEFCTN